MAKSRKKIDLKGIRFSSNAVRLNLRELAFSTVFVVAVVLFLIPLAWRHFTSQQFSENFRLAERLRDDYWLYGKWSEAALARYPVVFLGDSVIWGMYVDGKSTLPAKMNKLLGNERIANLAINGLHSVALKGMLEHFAAPIRGKTALLHFNPLWLNGRDNDLCGARAQNVNHPRLLPQFIGKPSSYDGDLTARMDAEKERYIPFFSLLNHVRLAFFDNKDIRQWLVDNPYSNPFGFLSGKFDACESRKVNDDESWEDKGIAKQSWEWMSLDESLQWKALTEIAGMLGAHDNKVIVMVGPINPYMLAPESLASFRLLQKDMKSRLDSLGVPCHIVPDMPSELYADASHPLEKGYQMIAEWLLGSGVLLHDRHSDVTTHSLAEL